MNNCLYKMQDGRSFTDYRPRCMYPVTDNQTNSYDNRMFLIKNAESMIKDNQSKALNSTNCNKKCIQPTITPKELDMVQCNKNSCKYHAKVNPDGIGTGRNYSSI